MDQKKSLPTELKKQFGAGDEQLFLNSIIKNLFQRVKEYGVLPADALQQKETLTRFKHVTPIQIIISFDSCPLQYQN